MLRTLYSAISCQVNKSRELGYALGFLLLCLFATIAPAQTVKEWLILGSYSVSHNKNFETDFIGSEAVIRPHGGLPVAGRTWRHYQTPKDHLDFLDFALDFFPVENAVAYAHVYVKSPKSDTVALYLGYDDRASVRVNGQLTWQAPGNHSFQAEDDTLQIVLQEGWNSVLFKIHNGVGEWALAARFAARQQLSLQAETPERLVMIPRADPELIRIRAIEPAERAVFTKENKPALQFKTVLYNPQQHGLGTCEARLFTRSGRVVGSGQTFELRAGEVRTVYFLVPASEILTSFEASGSWQMRLQFEKHEVRRIVPLQYDARLLGKILGTFEVQGFEQLASNGTTSFRRELLVPWEWAGMPMLFSADFGAAQGDILINGEQKAFSARGYTGDLALTDSAAANERFEILVHVTSLPAYAQRDSNAALTPNTAPQYFITVENAALLRYLNSATLLHQVRGDPTAEQKALDSTMFAMLKARDVKKLNQLIAEANSKLPQVTEALTTVPEVSLIATAPLALGQQPSFTGIADLYRATFQQVLRHLEKYPGFYFTQSEAAVYWWLEQRDPQLFNAIQEHVAHKRWELVGGSWVESEASLISGESLARQFLYGKRYLKEKFGLEPNLAWMPNAMAHPANMPQVLKKSGMNAIVMYRPWEALRLWKWEGMDGAQVLGYRPPEENNSPLTRDVGRHALVSKQSFRWPKALRVYGIDNQNSGVSGRDIRLAEDLAYVTANRDQRLAAPSVRMTCAQGFFDEFAAAKTALPVQSGAINPSSGGLWSSHTRYKIGNRQTEMILPVAEAFALFAQAYGFTYPHAQFTMQWRNLLTSQMQSLLAGAAHAELYREAQRYQREATETAKAALDQAMTHIEAAINTKAQAEQETPVVIYNPSAWPRTDYVEVEMTVKPQPPAPKKARPAKKSAKAEPEQEVKPVPYFRDAANARVPVQILMHDSTAEGVHYRFLFLPENVPALGYKVYWLQWDKPEELQHRVRVDASDNFAMSNRDFSILINANSGALERLVDNYFNREWMASQTGGLEVWGEKSGAALALAYDGTIDTLQAAGKPEILEAGPLRGRIRTRFQYRNSEITQEYVMYATLPRIETHYDLNWTEPNKAVKLVLPFNIPNQRAGVEIPYGVVEPAAHGEASLMHKWCDLSNEQFGLTLANAGSYSIEVQEATLRANLVRSGSNHNAGEEKPYHLAFALLPHKGDWKQAQSDRMSYDFNQPLMARVTKQHAGSLPLQQSFVSVEPAGVMLSALKKSEEDASWIIRLQENHGANTTATITLPFAAASVSEVNLLEWEEKPTAHTGARLAISLKPWEVKTLKVKKSAGQ